MCLSLSYVVSFRDDISRRREIYNLVLAIIRKLRTTMGVQLRKLDSTTKGTCLGITDIANQAMIAKKIKLS